MIDLSAARCAWPGVEVSDDEVSSYIQARGIDVETACLPDLYLACAIIRADPAALRAFEVLLAKDLPAAIAHIDGGTALLGDVMHAVRERVLGTHGDGKIREFRGRGELRGWLRVVAVREALQILRQRRREAPMLDDHDLADRIDEAHAGGASGKEAATYLDAFRAALATLTPRDRNLLRQHYLHGATVDELGALHGVHRSTAARWIADLREILLARTRRHIANALQLSGTELDSEMRRVAAQLEISLEHTLSFER